jgi:hypothetical protein
MLARVGEQVGCECAFRNNTPLFFSADMFGIGGNVPPVPVRGKLSAPRSSAMMTRIFAGWAKTAQEVRSRQSRVFIPREKPAYLKEA